MNFLSLLVAMVTLMTTLSSAFGAPTYTTCMDQPAMSLSSFLSGYGTNILKLSKVWRKALVGNSWFLRSPKGNSLQDKTLYYKVSESGEATHCGPKGYNLSLTWSPKVLDPKGHLCVSLKMESPVVVNKASCNVSVYMNETRSSPLLNLQETIDCSKIEQYVEDKKCPLKPKDKVGYETNINDLTIVPPGDYYAKATCRNEKEELILCVELELKVAYP